MKVTLVDDVSGDWTGLYIDGELEMEGHSLDVDDVLTALGIKFDSIESNLVDGGFLPEQLEDVSKVA